jgi:Holliday junction resolvasome RuvABC endonuclease subunit
VAVVLGIPLPGRLDASDALAAAICGLLRARDPEVAVVHRRGDWRAALARRFAK